MGNGPVDGHRRGRHLRAVRCRERRTSGPRPRSRASSPGTARRPSRTCRTCASPCRRSPRRRRAPSCASSSPTRAPRPARCSRRQPTFPETTTKYNNRPATTGAQIAASKAAAARPVGRVRRHRPGDRGRRATASPSPTAATTRSAFSSREGANPPQLVFTFPSCRRPDVVAAEPAATWACGSTTSSRPRRSRGPPPRPAARAARRPSRRTTPCGSPTARRPTSSTPTTNALRRVVPTADFTNALPVGGAGSPAGTTRSDSIAALTYDPATDTIYASRATAAPRPGRPERVPHEA